MPTILPEKQVVRDGPLVFIVGHVYAFAFRHALQVAFLRRFVHTWGVSRPHRATRLEWDGQPPRFALRSTNAPM
jgi:hypothetical protein